MLPSPRALLGVAPALLVVAGSFALSQHHGRDPAVAQTAAQLNHGETIEYPTARDEDRMHRVALKQETVEDLMDGRLTLAEAVERFETWSSAPDSLANLRASLRGRSDRERAANQVLSFVRVRASQEPARFQAALARVEADVTAFIADAPLSN